MSDDPSPPFNAISHANDILMTAKNTFPNTTNKFARADNFTVYPHVCLHGGYAILMMECNKSPCDQSS